MENEDTEPFANKERALSIYLLRVPVMYPEKSRFIRAVCGTLLAVAATVTPVFSGVANAQTPDHIYELNGAH
jgi:hypothetical protein